MRGLGGISPAFAVVIALVAGGCGAPAVPAPNPLSVTPDRGPDSLDVAVTIRGSDFAASTSTDFAGRDQSTLDARFAASLGTVPLLDVLLHSDGTLTATVPAGIPVGTYDLTVVDPAGREGRLASAYRVLDAADATPPVAGYRLDPIGPQQAWTPFSATITAIDVAGSTVTGFNGAVTLSDLTGTAVPGSPAFFRSGVWTGQVEIRSAHAADVLTVDDALGHTGASSPFPVAPTSAVALRFTTPARITAAGECSGSSRPLTVSLFDAFGEPTQAADDVALATALSPSGQIDFFSDEQCANLIARPIVAAGQHAATVWFRATRAGAATLALSAPPLDAAQLLTVLPGPAGAIAFVTPPRTVTAGGCSPAATVEVRDAWGNVVTGAPVPVALAPEPATATDFALFSDAACSAPATATATLAGTGRADFWFKGTAARVVTVSATAGLATATQDETVAPAAADHLAFTTPPRTATAGDCSEPVSFESRDGFGNPSPVILETPVALSAASGAGIAFYSDAACTVPITSVTLAPGGSSATVHFSAAAAGDVSVTIAAAGRTPPSQTETVVGGAADHLTWDEIPSPRAQGRPFSVRIVAVDRLGNLASSFTGTATLSLVMGAPASTLTCTGGCGAGLTTGAFTGGAWSGTVSVGAPASATPGTPDRRLLATAGARSGTSNLFELVDAPVRSPPTARLSAAPLVTWVGQAVTFDASGSTDFQTATADLEVSWDFEGTAATAPPGAGWSGWTTTPGTASHAFAAAGTYSSRVAVRDADGDLGFAGVTVIVRASRDDGLCLVDVEEAALDLDDGALGCAAGAFHGTDGRLSLAEALRLAVDGDVVAFSPSIGTIATGTPYAVTKAISLVAPGVVMTGSAITAGSRSTTTIVGLELTGPGTRVTVPNGTRAVLLDVHLHDSPGIASAGTLTLERVRMERCAGTCVVASDTSGIDTFTVRHSDFRGAGTGAALELAACASRKLALDAQSSVFAGFDCAIRIASACGGPTTIVQNTFESNSTAIAYNPAGASSINLLRNNVFTHQGIAAASGCDGLGFTARDRHLLWANASEGCLGTDPDTLAADPLYVLPGSGDLRLLPASPAVDAGIDLGLYVLPAFPAAPGPRFLGAGPDRGGLESY